MRLRRFFFSPDGAGGNAADSVLDQTFGPLSNVRPDLAGPEAKEKAEQQKGKAAALAVETGRPLLDSENPPPPPEDTTEQVEKPEAAREAPPAEGSEEGDGSDEQSPDDEQAALDALVEKYQGQPKSMAKAIRGLRKLQSVTAEEKKTLEAQIEAATTILDRDYTWENGQPVLKPEVAARTLQASGQRPKGRASMPTGDEIRAEVEAPYRERAERLFEPEQVPAFMAEMKPIIDAQITERTRLAEIQVQTYRYTMLAEVGNVVERHLREHPDDKDIMPKIDELYANIPEEQRAAFVLEEWIPIGKLAELVRLQARMPSMVKEAYELGKKHRGEAKSVTESGSPGRSRPGPGGARGTSPDTVKGMKERMIGGSGLPSIDSIFA